MIAKELKDQQQHLIAQNNLYKLSLKTNVRPSIIDQGILFKDEECKLSFINQGGIACPVHFQFSGEIDFHSNHLPYSVDTKQKFFLNDALKKKKSNLCTSAFSYITKTFLKHIIIL